MLRGTATFLYRLAPIVGFSLVINAQAAPAAVLPKAADAEATSTITVVKTAKNRSVKRPVNRSVNRSLKRPVRPVKAVKPAVHGGEAYRVGEGEHLWNILRQRMGGSASDQAIARAYNRTLRLNPGLKPDRLEKGQVIRLPALPGAPAAPAAAPAAEVTGAAPGPKADAAARVRAARAARDAEAAAAEAAAEAATAERQAERVRTAATAAGNALSAVYAELGEETVSRGKHFIPLPETGQMVLDAEKFPLLQVGGNTRFVLDIHGRIPREVDDLLLEAGGYRILRYSPGRGVRGLIDDALTGSGLDVKRGGSLRLGGPLEAEVGSDWLVTKGSERDVICLIDRPEEATSAALARHLARRGVHVIDVMVPEGAPARVMRREAEPLPDYTPPEKAPDTGQMVSRVLSMLGQNYERNAAVPLFGEELPGFDLKCNADFGFERGGKKYLVDLAGLSPRWRALLERRGYQVLVLPEGVKGEEAAAKLLGFLGEKYGRGYTLTAASRPPANNIRLKVPGLLVDAGAARFLLYNAEADEGLAAALSQAGLRVIQLK